MIDKKLQLKPGQTVAIVAPDNLKLGLPEANIKAADALLVFVITETQLRHYFADLLSAAAAGKLTWVAYPKAKQLDTDLNRDRIRELANQNGLDPVRQIAIDDTWSALRFKPLA
jgi:hypothetical protein